MGVLRVCRVATIPIPIRPRYKSPAKKLLSATSASPPPPPGCAGPVPAPSPPNRPPNHTPFCHRSGVRWGTTGGLRFLRIPIGTSGRGWSGPRTAGGAAGTREGPAGDERRGTSRAERFYDPAWRGGVPVPEGPRPRRRPSTGIAGQRDLSPRRHPFLSARGDPHDGNPPGPGPAAGAGGTDSGSTPATARGEGWEAEGRGGLPAGARQRAGMARRRPRARRPPPAAPTGHGNRPGNGTYPRATPLSLRPRRSP